MSEPPSPASTPTPETFDPRRRRLCPDGACVGVIGADGRCRTCGGVDPQGPPDPGAATYGGDQDDDRDADAAAADEATPARAAWATEPDAELAGPGGFDPSRALCPDGACVGVMGADNRCGVCGRGPDAAGA